MLCIRKIVRNIAPLLVHLINQMRNIATGKSKIMKCHETMLSALSSSYLPVLPHFPSVSAKLQDEVTFNIQRQSYKLINRSGAKMDLSLQYTIKIIINVIVLQTQVNTNQYLFLPFPLIENFCYVRRDT